jgi:hypothetical protein
MEHAVAVMLLPVLQGLCQLLAADALKKLCETPHI